MANIRSAAAEDLSDGDEIVAISDVQMQPMTEKPIKNILRPEP